MRLLICILFLPLIISANIIGALVALTWIGLNNGFVTVIEWAGEDR